MLEPRKIQIALLEAREAYYRNRKRSTPVRLGDWVIVADSKDYRNLELIYKARHPRHWIAIQGGATEIEYEIIKLESKWRREDAEAGADR